MANRVAAHQPKQDNTCPAHIAFFPIERTLTQIFSYLASIRYSGNLQEQSNSMHPVKMYLKPANRPQIKEEQSI